MTDSQDIIGVAQNIAEWRKLYGTPMTDMPELTVKTSEIVGMAEALLIAIKALELALEDLDGCVESPENHPCIKEVKEVISRIRLL